MPRTPALTRLRVGPVEPLGVEGEVTATRRARVVGVADAVAAVARRPLADHVGGERVLLPRRLVRHLGERGAPVGARRRVAPRWWST